MYIQRVIFVVQKNCTSCVYVGAKYIATAIGCSDYVYTFD